MSAALSVLRGETRLTGWEIPKDLSHDEWCVAGATLGRIERSVMWWIGDWWIYGQHRYGDRKAIVTALDWSGPDFQTCMNAGTVCRKFTTSRRREVLSFKHHAVVAALPPADADRLLDAAMPPRPGACPRLSAQELRGEVKRLRRAQRIEDLIEATDLASASLGGRVYGVLYADPPWQFNPYSNQTGMDRAADNHYPTMPWEAIRDLAVPAASDCALFMWVTSPLLLRGVRDVMGGWGFEYKSCLVWVKDKIGTGYWLRNQHELLLIGTRGDIPAPVQGDQYPSVISAPVTKHSAKPPEFAGLIEKMFPGVPSLEMFARAQRPGWDAWGNEAQAA
jgi:N6-adenosine-specific RNA methylase IME4